MNKLKVGDWVVPKNYEDINLVQRIEEIELVTELDAPEAWVECLKCGKKTEFYSCTENAVAEWNGEGEE